MNVYSTLLIATTSKKVAQFVLTADNMLPCSNMDFMACGSLKQAANMLKHITGVEAYDEGVGFGWAILKINSIWDGPDVFDHDGEQSIFLVHSTILPEPVLLAEGYKWNNMTNMSELSEQIKKIILKGMLYL